jgi:hypothetical protein
MAHLLKIGIPDAFGFIVGMAYVVSHMRGLAAEIANSAHNRYSFREGRMRPKWHSKKNYL